jgi:hypothetical protein
MGQGATALREKQGQIPHVIDEGHDPVAGFIEKGVPHAYLYRQKNIKYSIIKNS